MRPPSSSIDRLADAAEREAALARLPHGPEFRFVDRLAELSPGRSGVAEYLVPEDAAFLKGHFPGDPMMPGVLLVEAAAQLAGVVAQSDPGRAPIPELRLTALRNVKILGAVRPGDLLILRAEITGRLANLVQANVVGEMGATRVLTAELTLSGAGATP